MGPCWRGRATGAGLGSVVSAKRQHCGHRWDISSQHSHYQDSNPHHLHTPARRIAEHLLSELLKASPPHPSRPKAVTYYDEALAGFAVLDATGRCARVGESPIAAADTFVVYDDARCRGADLVLRAGAVGLVTLGPGTTKDRVMQVGGCLSVCLSD